MKFLIVFSVISLCALSEATFFHKKSLGSSSYGGSSSFGDSSSLGSSSSGSGDALGGIGNLLALPIQIKTQLIKAKRNGINNLFDQIEGALGKFSNLGSSVGSGHGFLSGASSGSAVSSGAAVSTGAVVSNAGASSNAAHFSGVQSYHPQPAAQAVYSTQPIVLHLYQEVPQQQVQVQAQAQAQAQTYHHVEQPVYQPAPVQTYVEKPVYQPAPVPVSVPVAQVQESYGPPAYVPPQPIQSFGSSSASASAQAGAISQVENTYLPPHGNCQEASHYH